MKKVLTLALVLFGVFSLAACNGGEEEEGQTDAEYLEEARDRLVFPVPRDNVRSNIDLPTELGNYPDVEITWDTDNADVVEADGTVHRPEFGDGNATVTLTATLTYEDEETTRSYNLTVPEMVDSIYYDDFSQLYEDDVYGEMITIQGVVTSEFSGGAFLWDGETHFGIYDAPNYNIQEDVEPGDEITYTGEYSSYNTLEQITNREEFVVVSSGNDHDSGVNEASIADIFNNYDPDADKDVHGQHFLVEGYLYQGGENENYFLQSLDGEYELEIYYYSLQNSLDALKDYEGSVVEMEVVYYDYSSSRLYVLFQGDEDDVTESDIDAATMIEIDGNALSDRVNTGSDVDLPTEGALGTQFDNWSSSDTTIIDDDGTFVDYPAEATVVTFTADASNGDATDTVSFDVEVLTESLSIPEAKNIAEGDGIYTSGYVYAQFNGGYFIGTTEGSIAIYSNDDIADQSVSVGDEVEVYGTRDEWNGLPQVGNLEVENVLSEGNDFEPTVADTVTVSELNALDETDYSIFGQKYEITGEVDVRTGNYTNTYVTDPETGDDLMIYYQGPDESEQAIADLDGQNITFEAYYYAYDSDGYPYVLFTGSSEDITVND